MIDEVLVKMNWLKYRKYHLMFSRKSLFLPFLLFLVVCQREKNFQSISQTSLSKELIETKADSGLVILLKDNEVVAQINLIWEDGIYKEGNAQTFQIKRDMGTLLSPIYWMEALPRIPLQDTVDVGNGIYMNKEGKEIRDHNADRGGYGVITAEQVIAFDSKVGITKIMERYGIQPARYSPLEVVRYYNRIAMGDTALCSVGVMRDIQSVLSKVIAEGTGKNLYREDLPIAGKTGYSEKNISACVYFSYGNSIYTCLVIISSPKEGIPSAGTMCGEVIKGIINGLSVE